MGTRTKILTAAVAVLALAFAMPVAAQDQQQPIALVYIDNEIDGPISSALATLSTEQGHDARAVDGTFVVNHGHRLAGTCVITVGRGATEAAVDLYERYGIDATVAQGADRHATAVLAAEAVAAC